jgi:hypothetical protein
MKLFKQQYFTKKQAKYRLIALTIFNPKCTQLSMIMNMILLVMI